MSTEAPAKRPLRADAERNRLRILGAAKTVFAERGLAASLDDVAAEAGVGVGTVYRRFPDKEALVDALFEDKIDEVTELARRGLEHESSWEGFELVIRGICGLQASDRGFKEVLLHRERGRERVAEAREKIAPLVLSLIERAKADGSLRGDIEQFDIPIINMMISFAAESTACVSEDFWERPMQLMLDGLRARRDEPTPLPGSCLDAEQFATAMSTGMSKGR